MSKKMTFIHTVSSLVGAFNDLSKELLPGDVEIFHIVDEFLLKSAIHQGRLSPFIFRRVADHVVAAVEGGSCLVQVTCSSISPCVDTARPFVNVPVLKIDEPMVARALSLGDHIGLAATLTTTLGPTTDLIYELARRAGREVVVETSLCEGAFKALASGDSTTHDHIVLQHVSDLVKYNDVVLLAQASMARAVAAIPQSEQRIPILSSPRLAVEKMAEILTTVS